MWSLSSTTYTSPAHGHLGWSPLRQQLSTARTEGGFGNVPLIASLAAELASIDEATQISGHPPFDGDAHPTFRSLVADLKRAHASLGDQLGSLIQDVIDDAAALQSYPQETQQPPWEKLIEATRPLRRDVLLGGAVVAGFDDALEAAEAVEDPGGHDRLERRLSDLRAVSELQGRGWKAVADEIREHFTVPPAGRRTGPGEFSPGTPADEILASLRARLEALPVEQEWVVWVGALAGPGGSNDRFPSLVSGPVAVCGLPCGENTEEWLEEARASLAMAFREAGLDLPADVKALGKPIQVQGVEFTTAAELWGSLGRPSSFVARVVVSAQSGEHAITQAKAMIRALYGMEDARVGRDLRSNVRVWTPRGTWWGSVIDASDHMQGEVYATQVGLRAAHVWARDLKSPLSAVELERLTARSLVRDPDASLDVRLARAFSSLEGLKARKLKLEQVPYRLWCHDAWDRAHRLADDAVSAVSGFFLQGSLPDEAARQELNGRQAEMLAGTRGRSPRERLRLAQGAAELLHPEHPHRRFVEDSVAALDDPARFSAERKAHTAAFARARRHRNLVVHGHRLTNGAFAPSVDFLTRLLEVAIGAEDARDRQMRTACLGSLRQEPSVRPAPRTFGEVFEAVPLPETDRSL
jgi:hypothetical protein